MSDEQWHFFLADGTRIALFPSTFLVTPLVFQLVMQTHFYAWQMKYKRN